MVAAFFLALGSATMGHMNDKTLILSSARPLSYVTALMAGVLFCLIAGWLGVIWRADTANHDVFWLFTGFQRLSAGETMLQSFYETNPPLSVFIYTPAFWLAEQQWLSLPRAVILYTSTLLALAMAATAYAARGIATLSRQQVFVICAGMLVCGTLLAGSNYGQRDHYLALAAVPVVLLLLGRTLVPRRLNMTDAAILFIGTLFLLLKPYYGLLPAFLMIHRAVKQKRVWALWDADFIVMALATVGYAVCVHVFFNDYLTTILPAVMDLYADSGVSFVPMLLVLTVSAWMIVMGFSFRHALPLETQRMARMFLLFAAFSFLIFLMMMKGYDYQLLPCLMFMYLAVLLIGDGLLVRMIVVPVQRALLLTAVIAAIFLILPNSFIPNKEAVRGEAVTKVVAACGDDCSYLIMGSTVRVTQLISYYAQKPHASRFAKFWFAEGMVMDGIDIEKDHKKRERYRHYVDMITADINRYKPRLILSCDQYANFIPWLSFYRGFREAFSSYKKGNIVAYDHSAFHGRTGRGRLMVECTEYNRI